LTEISQLQLLSNLSSAGAKNLLEKSIQEPNQFEKAGQSVLATFFQCITSFQHNDDRQHKTTVWNELIRDFVFCHIKLFYSISWDLKWLAGRC
jgi:hypothetical protein